jgi:polyhydroxyalkanoate synthase
MKTTHPPISARQDQAAQGQARHGDLHATKDGLFAGALRGWQRLAGSPGALALTLETRVGTTPCDESGTHRLLRYRRETPAAWAEPVLFCYALVNRPYILDLQSDKSVVRQYLDRGFEVYIIDWGVPSHADRFLNLEHYVCGFLHEAIQVVLREHGRGDLHLLGYCMGGTFSAMEAALHPDVVKSLTLLASPIAFAGEQALLNLWAGSAKFDVDAFVDAQGNCPAWFLQACFQNTKPIQNWVQKYLSMLENLGDSKFIANYVAMELWVNDNIPVAGETFREFVKGFYQNDGLVRGEIQVGDRRVDLHQLRCPLLLLTARNDHLVAPSSTEGIRPHVGSRDIESLSVDAGHVGLVVGGKAQRTVWPQATRWMAARSSPSLQSRAS